MKKDYTFRMANTGGHTQKDGNIPTFRDFQCLDGEIERLLESEGSSMVDSSRFGITAVILLRYGWRPCLGSSAETIRAHPGRRYRPR
jgi:hypothetical protein